MIRLKTVPSEVELGKKKDIYTQDTTMNSLPPSVFFDPLGSFSMDFSWRLGFQILPTVDRRTRIQATLVFGEPFLLDVQHASTGREKTKEY